MSISLRFTVLVLFVFVAARIVAQEPPARVKMHDAGCIEGDEAPWLFNCSTSVELLEPLTTTVHILVESAGGTATPNVDYFPLSKVLEFKPGETWNVVSVVTRGDNIDEEDVLTVLLRATQEGVVRASATMTFYDNDPTPTLDVSGEEVSEAAGRIIFHCRLSHTPKLAVSVDYATADGTATAGRDYVPRSGKLVMPAGTTGEHWIVVQVNDDADVEDNETVTLRLASPNNVFLARTSASGKIVSDDVEKPPPPPFVIGTASRTEGDEGTRAVDFDVELVTPHTSPLDVTLQTTENGSATAGVDFQPFSQTLTFPAGVTKVEARATIFGDTIEERDESFEVAVLEDGVVRATGMVRILDDDGDVPVLSIGDVEVTETDGYTGASFPVTLSKAVPDIVRVSYRTLPGTAQLGVEHGNANGELVFQPGDTTRTVAVFIRGDHEREENETFQVEIYSPRGAKIGDGIGTCTIVDDEPTRRRASRH